METAIELCEDCNGTGIIDKNIPATEERLEQDVECFCDCEAGRKMAYDDMVYHFGKGFANKAYPEFKE